MPCLPSENRLMLWVRPGVLDASASRFCWVSVLMQVDLPALERPTKAISGTSCGGRGSSLGAVVRKRAVCSHAVACAAGVTSWTFWGAAAFAAAALRPGGEVMGAL